MALWGGRFEKGVDAFTQEFGASLEVDKNMAQQDIAGSRAHAKMLAKQGIITSDDQTAIDAFNEYCNKFVSGTVRFKLYKGSLLMDGIKSEHTLYDESLATYGEGDTFDRTASKGFIDLHSLMISTWSKAQGPASGKQPA